MRTVIAFCAFTSFALAQGPAAVIDYSGFNPAGPVAPGSIASVYGAFGTVATTVVSGNQLNPMPRELAGIRVRVNNTDCPLYFVSSGQINFVVPVNTPEGRQTAEVLSGTTVVARGEFNVWRLSPALASRTTDSTRPGAIANADGSLNLDVPAIRGGVILLFATGCGATNPPITDGAPPAALASVVAPIKAYVSVEEAEVIGAAASPQFPGVCQINIRIPNRPHVAGTVPVFIELNGLRSNFVSVRVQP
jgi:uncharacterized protein (TIGR03437 family)